MRDSQPNGTKLVARLALCLDPGAERQQQAADQQWARAAPDVILYQWLKICSRSSRRLVAPGRGSR